jgi:hypothetical protein
MFQVLDEVQRSMGDDVALARVQVGPAENQELCRWLGIIQVPTVLYLFRNQIIDIKVGYAKSRLLSHVQMLRQGCLAAGPERLGLMPLIAGGSPNPANSAGARAAPLSPGFGRPVAERHLPTADPDSPAGPPMRFGLLVTQAVAPVVVEKQKKTWLSRWLGLE